MATKKVYHKAELVTSIDHLIQNRHKPFILYSDKHIEYNKLAIMSLASVVNLINEKCLFFATIVEEQVIRKTKAKVTLKTKSNVTDCKATLDDIYNPLTNAC